MLLIVIICLLVLIYFVKNKSNKQNINKEQVEEFKPEIKLTDREQINNFSNSFFNFNNRINQLSMYDDPIDKINRDRANCNFNVGLDIKEVYDYYTTPTL